MSAAHPRYAWHNGELVAWEACVLHARSQGAFWGANVFEGIRGYWSGSELHLFRLDDHLERLARSMKCMRLAVPWSLDDLRAACLEVCRANDLREDVHVVVVAYFGMGPGCDTMNVTDDTGVHITAVPKPRAPTYETGVSVGVSSWRRISDETTPPRIKAGANYQNNRLAHQEAVRNGYDTALILNQSGTVAEAPGACVAMVRDGRLVTPPATSGALEGITLDTVLELARGKLGLEVEERPVDRTELYVADEVLLCGTLAEILPVVAVDRIPVGDGVPGPLTLDLQLLYEEAVHAGSIESDRPAWTTAVYGAEQPLAAAAG